MKNILFAASECVPFVKTGGLADVVGALPKALYKGDYDVRVILPNYTCIPWEYRGKFKFVSNFYMDYGQRSEPMLFLKSTFATHSFYWDTKSIMTIHNLKFQGVWDIDHFIYNTNLPGYMFTPDKLEFKKDANMLKGGLVYADYITTVSETYAEEIKTPYYGEQLDGLLCARSRSLRGILNGIDYSVYNPETDPKIAVHYNEKNAVEKKKEAKRALQKELGLPVDDSKFMIAIISRLTDQKGLDLVDWITERIVDEFTQFVIIGTGESRYEDMFRYYQGRFPDRVSANIFYSDALAHKSMRQQMPC